jgi:ABC-2 type transport system permease protein
MTAYLSFEWLKLTKRWMPRAILALVLGLVIVFFWGTGANPDGNLANIFFPRALLAALVATAFAAPFFWPVLGGSWAGNEYGWGSIRIILSRRPHRIEQVGASLAVLLVGVGLALLATLIVGSLAGIGVGVLTGHSAFVSGVLSGTFLMTLVKTFVAAWYGAAFVLLLAFAAGIIFRSAAAGITVGIGSTLAQLILYRILLGQGGVWRAIAEHFPVLYVQDLVGNVAAAGFKPGTPLSMVNPADPSVAQSIVALGIMMAALLAATFFAVRSRDVTA